MKAKSIISAALAAVVLAGCAKSMDYATSDQVKGEGLFNNETDAIVTVKTSADGTVYLQLDEETRLFPREEPDCPDMCRAMCRIIVREETVPGYGYLTDVLWIEPLEQGAFASSAAGSDGLDLEDDWMTCVEDGWLTLHYSTWWGYDAVRHEISLVSGTDASDPYVVELRHDACGDLRYEYADALIAFDINSLPDTGDQTMTLTLRWKDTGGADKSRQFEFRSRK